MSVNVVSSRAPTRAKRAWDRAPYPWNMVNLFSFGCHVIDRAYVHEEPHKVPLLITLSDGCYAQFPVIILPPVSCRLAGVRLAVIDRDFHRGDETILNFATVW